MSETRILQKTEYLTLDHGTPIGTWLLENIAAQSEAWYKLPKEPPPPAPRRAPAKHSLR